jgi:chromate transport protein ChrA
MVLLGEDGRMIRALVAGLAFAGPTCVAILYVFPG